MEVLTSSETLVHIRTARVCIIQDSNINNYRCENLKFYIIKEHSVKMYEGVEVCLHILLTALLDDDGLSASRSAFLTPVPVGENI
jgi:hypothetical protein